MRTSRISQDTTRALSTSSSAVPTRTTRTTRSSLARFALKPSPSPPPDIEDAIPRALSTRSALKRKRPSPSPKLKLKDDLKSEPQSDIDSALSSPPSSPVPPPPKRKTRQPARTLKTENGDLAIAPPSDWEEIYDLVKQMRTEGPARDAAVDTMGCHALALKTASPRDQRFQTLIALMLSSQTKDTTNYLAMRNLQTNLPAATPDGSPGLTLENILAVDPDVLNQMIWSVGFHNNKTKYIKAAAEILRDRHDGDIPDTAEGLMALPGVGPKMAYLCLSAAWGRVEGIGVDVHVHRIVNLWGWHKTSGPEATRLALQTWLPRERWAEINWLLVGLGQTVCTPEAGRRRCGECEVGLRGLCRASDKAKVRVGRRAREEGLKLEYERKGGEEEMKAVKEEGVVDAAGGVGEDYKAEVKVKVERNEIPLSAALKLEEDEELAGESAKVTPGQLE